MDSAGANKSEGEYIVLRNRRVPRRQPLTLSEVARGAAPFPGTLDPEQQVAENRDPKSDPEERESLRRLSHVSSASGDYLDVDSSMERSLESEDQRCVRIKTEGEMEQKQRNFSSEEEEEEPQNTGDNEGMTYTEFMQRTLKRSQDATARSVRHMCNEAAKILKSKSQEKEELLQGLLEAAAKREEAAAKREEAAAKREEAYREIIANITRSMTKPDETRREPMQFSGSNPREWLFVMKQFFDHKNFTEAMRLKEVPFLLRGEAHMFYCSLARHYPERLPKTWDDLEKLLLQRFSNKSPVETFQRLMQVRYKDSIADVAAEFERICAEGDPLPPDRMIRIFLSRFPKSMIDDAMKKRFNTWVKASDYLQTEHRERTLNLAEWYQLTPPEYKREVENDIECVREGWIIKNTAYAGSKSLTPGRQGPSGKGAETNKGVPGGARSQQGQGKTNFSKFLELLVCHQCQGKGHRAKECPSRDMAARRDGSKCNKCGGLGHWARSCPTLRPGGNSYNFKKEAQPAAQPDTLQTGAGGVGNGQA